MNEWNRLKLVTAAAVPALSLPDAKKHLRIFHDDEDDYITGIVAAAQGYIEGPNGAGVALKPQTWRLSLDYFPCEILIPLGPVTEITGISYTGANGNEAMLDSWRSDLDASPVRIWPARDTSWPAIICEPGAVKVTFTAGFEAPPADLIWALKLIVSHLYEHREAALDTGAKFGLLTLPLGAEHILDRYRVGRFA